MGVRQRRDCTLQSLKKNRGGLKGHSCHHHTAVVATAGLYPPEVEAQLEQLLLLCNWGMLQAFISSLDRSSAPCFCYAAGVWSPSPAPCSKGRCALQSLLCTRLMASSSLLRWAHGRRQTGQCDCVD